MKISGRYVPLKKILFPGCGIFFLSFITLFPACTKEMPLALSGNTIQGVVVSGQNKILSGAEVTLYKVDFDFVWGNIYTPLYDTITDMKGRFHFSVDPDEDITLISAAKTGYFIIDPMKNSVDQKKEDTYRIIMNTGCLLSIKLQNPLDYPMFCLAFEDKCQCGPLFNENSGCFHNTGSAEMSCFIPGGTITDLHLRYKTISGEDHYKTVQVYGASADSLHLTYTFDF